MKNQLTYILEEQARLKEIELSLRELLNGLAVEGGDEELAIQKLIQLSNQDKKRLELFRDSIFNDMELELPNMNDEHPEALEWIALTGQITKYYEIGEPSSSSVQNIIRRMLEKQKEEFKDEDEFINKLWDLRKSPEASEKLGLYPIKKEVLDFMESAYEIFMSTVPDSSTNQGGKS